MADEEEDVRRHQASWIRKRTAISLCVKMGFQIADLFSDFVTPILYFYNRGSASDETSATIIQLKLAFLPDEPCLISVPPGEELRNSTLAFVNTLSTSSLADITAKIFAENESTLQLPTWFEVLYGAHAVIALCMSLYVVHSGLPYLRHCLEPYWRKNNDTSAAGMGGLNDALNSFNKSRGNKANRVGAVRTDDEEHGGTKDGVLTETIETEGLKLAYLKASKLMFWVEDSLGLILSAYRFVRRCTLTGLTLRSVDQVLMLIQFLLSIAMLGCKSFVPTIPQRRAWAVQVHLRVARSPLDFSPLRSRLWHIGRAHAPQRAAAQTPREARCSGEGGDHRPRRVHRSPA